MPTNYNTSKLASSFLPATAVLEMTYKCNHFCLFCSCPWERENGVFKKKEELTGEEWKTCIKTLSEMGVCNIAFSGGEPLLNPNLIDLIEFAASCLSEYVETREGKLETWYAPPKLYLLSNGKLMNQGTVDLCKKHNVNLSLSLPGIKSYSDHTQMGSPDTILEWFEKAHKAGVSTTVNITVTKKNIFELYEAISMALLAGADTLLLNRFMPGGRGLKYANELSLDSSQIREMMNIAETVLQKANRYGSIGTEIPKCIVDLKKYKHLKVGTRCSASINFFVIDPSGYTRVCNHSEIRLNHFKDIQELKTNPYWIKFTQKDYLPNGCYKCKQMGECDGGCREAAHIVGGDIDSPDPVFNKNL